MLKIVSIERDKTAAESIRNGLKQLGFEFTDASPFTDGVLLFIHSPESSTDGILQQEIIDALDNNLHILPVMIRTAPLPKLIGHLEPVDFTKEYAFNVLAERIRFLESPAAPPPLRVLTPRVIRRNRRYGLVVTAIVSMMFVWGIYLVGVQGVQFPYDEFAPTDTALAQTRDAIIQPTLTVFQPAGVIDQVEFESTVQAMPTRLRPFLALTATAIAEEESE